MSTLILIHSIGMILSLIIASFLFFNKKGTKQHKLLGRIYVAMMSFACISSFFMGDSFSFLHILSAITLYWLASAVWAVRRKNGSWRREHARYIASSYIGIIIAGVGVIVRHITHPGNAQLGYIYSGFTAVVVIPIMIVFIRLNFSEKK